jgi:YVTN family beta-propeller protein
MGRARRPRRMSRARRLGLMRLAALIVVIVALVALLLGALGGSDTKDSRPLPPTATRPLDTRHFAVPRLVDSHDVYAGDRPGMLSPVVRHYPTLVYVPNSESDTVSVINPRTYRVIRQFPVGVNPQHVVPSYDLKTLWVNNDQGNSLTQINPAYGRPGKTIPVDDPYNLYFTPDGHYAIVVEERNRALDFRDPHTMRSRHTLSVPCDGINHMDFTANGRYLVASCEFGGGLVKVDLEGQKVVRRVDLGSMPQDVKLSPDGKLFYIADIMANGVWVVDAQSLRKVAFIPTGAGAHGLFVSRDSKYLYVSNRMAGSISVISFATRKVIRTWQIPGGASPDMGGISPDGKVLWVSGRYSGVVYAISTRNGHLLARIPVGSGPHGLCVYPQPGRYSLGHTGVFR